MATTASYYLNGPSLATATSAFIDPDMTIFAPDGYYSDGTVVRQMVGGIFLPGFDCPMCGPSCDTTISTLGDPGLFRLNINTGGLPGSVGAIVIKFTTSIPNGFQAVLGSNLYNRFSSPLYGRLAGVAGVPTYIGDTTLDCGLVSGSPFTVDIFDYYSGAFFNTMTTIPVSVAGTQLALTATAPGACVLVVPKTSPLPSELAIEISSLCTGTEFTVEVDCPISLPPINASEAAANSTDVCLLLPTIDYYVAYVNGSSGTLGLYDIMFTDPNGEFELADGYYRSPTAVPGSDEWFRVVSGVVTEFGSCPAGPNFTAIRCGDDLLIVVSDALGIAIGDLIQTTSHPACYFTVVGNTSATPDAVTSVVHTDLSCADTCQYYTVENNTADPIDLTYTDCGGDVVVYPVAAAEVYSFCAKPDTMIYGALILSFDSCFCP